MINIVIINKTEHYQFTKFDLSFKNLIATAMLASMHRNNHIRKSRNRKCMQR
jgi:hypothetical protein